MTRTHLHCCEGPHVAAPILRSDLAPPEHPLFDVHVHIGPSDSGELFYPDLSPGEWENITSEANVAHSCVFPPLRQNYLQANEALADWAEKTDGRVLAFARLGGDIPWCTKQLWQLRRKLRARIAVDRPHVADLSRFRGVKLLPHLDGLPDAAMFDQINELGIPVLVHGGIHVTPDWIDQELAPLVEGPLIVAHLGAFPAGDHELRAAVDLAKRRPNVYLDTSGVWLASFLAHAASEVGDKLLFGSDAPLTHPLVAWHHTRVAIQDDGLLHELSWLRPCELFGIDPGPGPARPTAPAPQ